MNYVLAFYITLGVLVLVTAILIGFFIYVNGLMPGKLMGSVMTTLHAALFGYESALI